MRVLALLLVAAPVTAAPGAAPRGEHGTLFGMDVPSLEQLDSSESAMGVRAAIVGTFADWAHAPQFPRRLAEAVKDRDAVLLVSWEPWDSWRGGADQPRYALRRISSRPHDRLR